MTAENEEGRRISIFDGRSKDATSWDLPPWGHPLGCGIFPLMMHLSDRAFPIGTAFCTSQTGLVATAAHNAREAIKHHPRAAHLLQMRNLPSEVKMSKVSLSVLHNWLSERDKLQINLWPLEGAQGAQPTDLLFGFPKYQRTFPYLPLPISLAIPRIGDKVYCLGYRDTKLAGNALLVDRLEKGNIEDWASHYQHKLHAVEGTVKNIFTQNFLSSYVRGACFSIDTEVASGMSGGPVFNEDGYVCGIISATATRFFDYPTSLITLFYPAMMTNIKIRFRLAEAVSFDSTLPLLSLIDRGLIVTDGTESMVTFRDEEEGWRVGPMIHEDDSSFVFDDFHGFQDGRPATIETREVLKLRKKDDCSESG